MNSVLVVVSAAAVKRKPLPKPLTDKASWLAPVAVGYPLLLVIVRVSPESIATAALPVTVASLICARPLALWTYSGHLAQSLVPTPGKSTFAALATQAPSSRPVPDVVSGVGVVTVR